MVSHIIIDKWYLTISFLITLAWQLTGFAIAWTFKVSSILLNPLEAGLLLTMNSLTRLPTLPEDPTSSSSPSSPC